MLPPINTNVYQKPETEIQTAAISATSSIDTEAQNSSIPGIDQAFLTGNDLKKTTQQQTGTDQKKEEEDGQLSQAVLSQLEQKLQEMHNIGFQFTKHEATGKTMIKVVNKDTGAVIREIPPEKALDMAAKMQEMLGLLFDETA